MGGRVTEGDESDAVLLADVGGTNVRIAVLGRAGNDFEAVAWSLPLLAASDLFPRVDFIAWRIAPARQLVARELARDRRLRPADRSRSRTLARRTSIGPTRVWITRYGPWP